MYWEGNPLETANKLMETYGYPDEALPSKLIWYHNGPWKRTVIYRETVPHYFPHPHPDFLAQTIDYQVPLHLYDDIAVFDGSLTINRTKGEVTAMCDQEAMNILSLNVLNDIVTGWRDVEGAKMFLAETAYRYLYMGVTSPYTEGFLFPKQHNTEDPGMMYFE